MPTSSSSTTSSSSSARVLPLNASSSPAATGNPLHSDKSHFKRLESESASPIASNAAAPNSSSPPSLVQGNDDVGHTCCSSLMGRGLHCMGAAFSALLRALAGGARRILGCGVSITVRFDTLVSLVTLYVLLMDVIRLAVPKKYDPFLFGVTLAALFILSLDCILMLMAHTHCSGGRSGGGKGCWYLTVTGYALSFRFWLDVLVLLSVILSVCGVDARVGSQAIASANPAHGSTTAQSMYLVGPSVLLNTLHKFRLFRVIDRHVIPNGRGVAASSTSSSSPSSSSTSASSPSSASGSTPTNRAHQQQQQQQQQLSTSILSAGLAWVRGEGARGASSNSSNQKRSSRPSLLPRASISFVGRDHRAYDGGGGTSNSRNSSKDSSGGSAGGGEKGGGGGSGKPLEAELYDLTMHRLILTLFGALLILAFLNSNHARVDRALPAATAMLHAAQAKGDNGTMVEVVLTSYVDYFTADGKRGGGTLLSLQLGTDEATAPFLLHDASRLAILRDSEIYRLEILSFPLAPPPPASSLPPSPALPVVGGSGGGGGGGGGNGAGAGGGGGPVLDGVPPGGGGWEERDDLRRSRQQQQHPQRRLASVNATQPIAFTAVIFDVSSAYRQRLLLEDLYLPLFLAALLILGAHAFSQDARRLIVSPIDWIIGMVQKLAADPLGVLEVELLILLPSSLPSICRYAYGCFILLQTNFLPSLPLTLPLL